MTISGDLMQRVTETGLRDWSDMDTICQSYERNDINREGYRQTERLFNIARDLCPKMLRPRNRNSNPPTRTAQKTRLR